MWVFVCPLLVPLPRCFNVSLFILSLFSPSILPFHLSLSAIHFLAYVILFHSSYLSIFIYLLPYFLISPFIHRLRPSSSLFRNFILLCLWTLFSHVPYLLFLRLLIIIIVVPVCMSLLLDQRFFIWPFFLLYLCRWLNNPLHVSRFFLAFFHSLVVSSTHIPLWVSLLFFFYSFFYSYYNIKP